MSKRCGLVLLICFLALAVGAQEIRQLEPGKSVEREIAGGQSHTYTINLKAGQFVHVLAEQKGVDVALSLAGPDGKQVAETDLTGPYGMESLSYEPAASGDYRLTIRATGAATLTGAYDARLEARTAATEQDKNRIAGERLLAEANKLSDQGAATSEPTVVKAQQALALFRRIVDRYWEAQTLDLIGSAFDAGHKFDQAIESYSQALSIHHELKNRYGEAGTLNSMGATYYRLGRYDKALEYYE